MKPILFNTEMVMAIIEGRKTVTRRVVKPQPKYQAPLGFVTSSTEKTNEGKFGWGVDENGGLIDYAKPPYQKDDILYVRETWWANSRNLAEAIVFLFKADAPFPEEYSAIEDFKWRPSIHMPREIARIFLKVTDVRVERLQDITREECYREGIIKKQPESPIYDFMKLWNSTLKGDKEFIYGWGENPFVWVIDFQRVTKDGEPI